MDTNTTSTSTPHTPEPSPGKLTDQQHSIFSRLHSTRFSLSLLLLLLLLFHPLSLSSEPLIRERERAYILSLPHFKDIYYREEVLFVDDDMLLKFFFSV